MSKLNRRWFNKAATVGVAALLSGLTKAQAEPSEQESNKLIEEAEKQHLNMMTRYGHLTGGEKLKIGMVVYPGMFLLDLVGPLAVFEALMNREIHLIWKNLEPVNNIKNEYSAYIPIKPTSTFNDCPEDLDVLFIPGGVPGTLAMMEDSELIHYLKTKGSKAKYITSVCTGSLILAAAGLLNGYKATSHWVTKDSLKDFGAIPTKGRVVVDRNRITGGGVTAGIDFGLRIVGLLRSPDYARAVQLYLEYDPSPPFNAGSPDKAPPIVKQFLEDMFVGLKESVTKVSNKLKIK
jgi:cyclohexyl-isocyanide hydratase